MLEENYLDQVDEELQNKYKEASSLLDIGKFEEAEVVFNEILKEEKLIPAVNKLAVIEIYKDNLENAKEIIEDILEENPEYVPAITNLGSIEKKKGNLERAKLLYKKSIDLEPEYGNAYNNLGVIYREQGQYSKSVKYLKKARKKGSFSVKFDDKPFYKNKGCLFIIAIVVIIILFFLLV